MRRLLYPSSIPHFFANAGMALVERSVLAGLVARGVSVRIAAAGNEEELNRLRTHCAALDRPGVAEVVPIATTTPDDAARGIDALLIHSLPLESCWGWVTAGRLVHRLPTVQYVHSLLLAEFERVMWTELWRAWDGSPAARLVVPSRSTAARLDLLAADAASRGATLPAAEIVAHGVDVDAVQGGSRSAGRTRLGLSESSRVVLSLGRISAEKGPYHQLVLAFADLVDAGLDDLALVLAGAVSEFDERYVTALRRLAKQLGIADRVLFVVGFDDTEKPDLLAAADVMVSLVSNPQESFGIALLEGLAVGLPVVAVDWDGYPEVLPDAYRDRLVPTVASPDVATVVDWHSASEAATPLFSELVERLAEALAGDDELRRLAARGPAHAAAFRWDTAVDRLLRLVDEVCSGTAAPVRPPPMVERTTTMVDGLATIELGPDTVLRIADVSPGARSAALGFASLAATHSSTRRRDETDRSVLGALLRRGVNDDDPLGIGSGRRRAICDAILERCRATGPAGVTLSDLRTTANAPTPHTDWILLKLIQSGAVSL